MEEPTNEQQPDGPGDQTEDQTDEASHNFETVDAAVAELKRVRSEAAERRVTLRTLEDRYSPWQGYSDDDFQVWSTLATTLAQDPEQGARAFIEIGRALLGEEEAPKEEPQVETETADQPSEFNAEAVQKMITAALQSDREERTKSDAEKGRMAEFDQQVEAAGFKKASPEYYSVVSAVAGGQDIEAAIKATQDWRQGIIDSFVTERQGDKGVRPPSGAAAGQQAVEAPKTLEEATAALRQMIQDQGGL